MGSEDGLARRLKVGLDGGGVHLEKCGNENVPDKSLSLNTVEAKKMKWVLGEQKTPRRQESHWRARYRDK